MEDNGINGLINLGNTCYLNSAIQILFSIDEIRDIFQREKIIQSLQKKKNEDKRNLLTLEFIELVKIMSKNTCIIKPTSFKNVVGFVNENFRGYNQHDSCEFMLFILDNLHETIKYKVKINYSGKPKNLRDRLCILSIENWKTVFEKNYSELIGLFYGQFKTTLVKRNNHKIFHFDPFNIINLSITDCNDIYECLNKFIESEKLDDPKSKYKEKYDRIWRLPKYLWINFKRFEFGEKIENMIHYPIHNLNLEDYTDSSDKINCVYNLKGVVNHIGSIDFGHYYCYCNHNDKWYSFNDEDTDLIEDTSKIMNENAYILLYERV